MWQSNTKHAMRSLFTLFAFLSAMSILLLGTSFVIETFSSGFKNFTFSGTEMTVSASGADRILLVITIICVFTTFCLWLKLSGRD